MGDVVSLVVGALRHKLREYGVGSLTSVEWQLLRVSTLLHALEGDAVERLFGESPLAELSGIAEGLDAIGVPEASTLLHYTVREIDVANAPGAGAARAHEIRRIAAQFALAVRPLKNVIEARLLDFAFRQPELMPDAESAGLAPALAT